MDALVTVAETYLAHADASGSGGDRTQIFVHLDHDPLGDDGTLAATLDDGTRVSAETFRRLSCDAAFVPIRHGADGSVDAGRRTRNISSSLRRALWIRDRGCRFPGCPNHLYLHAHHITHWADGGANTAKNLVLLCSTHHRLLHEGGFGIRGEADGDITITNRRGKPIAASPLCWEVEGAKIAWDWVAKSGLTIDAETAFPQWDGNPVQYRWIVDGFATAFPDELRPEVRAG
jgi:hypothetical protein